MEKKKSDIGHNSNLLIEDAFKETIKDAEKFIKSPESQEEKKSERKTK